MCQRSSSSTRSHALVHPGQRAIGQVVEKRVLPCVEDDPLEQHVVEADALAQSLAARGDLGGHRGQPLLEELEHRGRGFGAGRGTPLLGGGSRQSQHLGGDAVEEPRMALLVATLEEEHPGHQALLGHQGSLPGCIGERRDVLGDEIVTDAEAREERLQAAAALVREPRPFAGIGGEVDGRGIQFRRATSLEKKLGQKLRFANESIPPMTLCSRSGGSARRQP